jgi:hypothetical protein
LVLAWRRWLDRHEIVQPFKQAHREVYSPTAEELAAGSVGNDPTWIDRAPTPTDREYWTSIFVSPLSESGLTRRAVLEDLIPRLPMADRLQLADCFLVVRGDRATYKIHLGSGNVLREPGGDYLCLVPDARSRAGREVRVPFEGDDMLALILKKAFILADDQTLTDPLIVPRIGQS